MRIQISKNVSILSDERNLKESNKDICIGQTKSNTQVAYMPMMG